MSDKLQKLIIEMKAAGGVEHPTPTWRNIEKEIRLNTGEIDISLMVYTDGTPNMRVMKMAGDEILNVSTVDGWLICTVWEHIASSTPQIQAAIWQHIWKDACELSELSLSDAKTIALLVDDTLMLIYKDRISISSISKNIDDSVTHTDALSALRAYNKSVDGYD